MFDDEWIDTKTIMGFKDMVRQPEFAETRICSVCACFLGAQWQHNDDWGFVDGECPCCGRRAPVAMIGNWKWRDSYE